MPRAGRPAFLVFSQCAAYGVGAPDAGIAGMPATRCGTDTRCGHEQRWADVCPEAEDGKRTPASVIEKTGLQLEKSCRPPVQRAGISSCSARNPATTRLYSSAVS